MKFMKAIVALAAAAALGFAAYEGGLFDKLEHSAAAPAAVPLESTVKAPAVSVIRVVASGFAESAWLQ